MKSSSKTPKKENITSLTHHKPLVSKLTAKQPFEHSENEKLQLEDMKCIATKFLMMMDIKENFVPFFKKYYKIQDQKLIHQFTIKHEINLIYPISKDYQIEFLKLWVKTLEENENEVCETTNRELGYFHPICEDEHETTFYKHISFAATEGYIGLIESKSIISTGCTDDHTTWIAENYLATWLVQHPDQVRDLNVLELGAGGTGLVGITASHFCDAKKVIISDGDPIVFHRMKDSVALNFGFQFNVINQPYFKMIKYLTKEIGTMILPKKKIARKRLDQTIRPDVILGTFILENQEELYCLLDAMETISNYMKNKCKFALATEVRDPNAYKKFIEMLKFWNFAHLKIEQLYAGKEYDTPGYQNVRIVEVFKDRT